MTSIINTFNVKQLVKKAAKIQEQEKRMLKILKKVSTNMRKVKVEALFYNQYKEYC